MEAAYNNPPEAKSENLNPPRISLELKQCRSPRRTMTPLQVAQTLLELHAMGLVRQVIDRKGVVRWQLTEKSL